MDKGENDMECKNKKSSMLQKMYGGGTNNWKDMIQKKHNENLNTEKRQMI